MSETLFKQSSTGYNDIALLSLCKSPCKHIMSNHPNDFEDCLAGFVSQYQCFTIKLSVWQQVTKQETRGNVLQVELKRTYFDKIRGMMVSQRQAGRMRKKHLKKSTGTRLQHVFRTGSVSSQAETTEGPPTNILETAVTDN